MCWCVKGGMGMRECEIIRASREQATTRAFARSFRITYNSDLRPGVQACSLDKSKSTTGA